MKMGILFTTNSRNYYYLCNLYIYATSDFTETIIICVGVLMCTMDWRRAGGHAISRTDITGFFLNLGIPLILKIDNNYSNDEKLTIAFTSKNYYNM